MASFTDLEGNEWTLTLRYSTVKEITDRTGIQLISLGGDLPVTDNPEEIRQAAEEKYRNSNPVQDLIQDPASLQDALWVIVRDQAEDRDMNEAEVKDLFDRGPLMAQIDAFTNALTAFFGTEQVKEVLGQERPTPTKKTESKDE